MEMMLELQGVGKQYKEFALQDVTVSLPKGYIMGYIGRNGAGKTTTINLINRICNPSEGTIRVNGITYEEDPIRYKEQIGFIGDESYFPKEMRIKDIRSILKHSYQSFDEKEFNQMIKNWKLPEKQKIEKFSRGMKVKLMFACTLCRETKLLILDEATNGLDPVMREEVLELLQDYIASGERSILFSTHMLNDLEQIADYIVFIEDGKIILNDTKDDILESYVKIKGKKEDLSQVLRERMIGISTKDYGFEGLLSTENADLLSKKYVIEKPNIDQIMVHMLREKKGGHAYEGI